MKTRPRAVLPVLAAVAAGVAVAAWVVSDDGATESTPQSSTTLEDRPSRPAARWPGPGHELVRIRRATHVDVLRRPGGSVVTTLRARTAFGSIRVLPAVEPRRRWVGVAAPELGNGEVGWLRYDPDKIRLGDTRISLSVDLSKRVIELRRGRRVLRRAAVSVGRFGSETPVGRFAVTDRITRGLNPAYGEGAIALSARQPNLPPGWIGGDRIAVHGWYGPVGEAESSGCLRVSNPDIEALLDRVPLGAPVSIRA